MKRPRDSSPLSEESRSGGDALSFVVGIGASAGGLEALSQFLRQLSPDTGMAFVLVQHLDPQHESALTQILGRATSLPVLEIEDGQRLEPDHVYVIPPDAGLTVSRGQLHLERRAQTRAPHRVIDRFFESLAEERHERAIGVVLSGSANDGTLGLEAIKAEGGFTFAQDDSAKHDSMPRSAIEAGVVDLVASPAAIAEELGRIARHPYGTDWRPLEAPPDAAEPRAADGHERILELLRKHSGVDFSLYKSSTIQRRIARRMVLTKHDSPEHYASFLRGNAQELDALYSDVLISVTSFFRNAETFDVLQREILPQLAEARSDEPARAWVLGCSTGQEAYSVAMAYLEVAERAPRMRRIQIFATDLNEALLERARHGLYPKGLVEGLSPERLRRFFVEEEGGYRVSKMLREMLVFARQDLIGDPPFSRMDLISCRNLLIYLEPALQKRVLPTFHYALKPHGFLLLGASESIAGFAELFEPLDKKHKIYVKRSSSTPTLHLPLTHGRSERMPRPLLRATADVQPAEQLRAELIAQREADRITMNQLAPPGVLIDDNFRVLQFRGQTGDYLEPPSGSVSMDLLKLARQGLMLPLRGAVNQARKTGKPELREDVAVKPDGKTRRVNLRVIPLKNLGERHFLVLFEEPTASDPRAGEREAEPTPATREATDRVVELEREVAETREYVQAIQEQHEAANEELQAANEEVQSSNEELQSINEELETSKEELESANEELITVNEELTHRNLELSRLNGDLINLQNSTKLALVVLGRDLTVRRFSPQAEKQLSLVATDIGRPIGHIRHDLVLPSKAGAAAVPLDLAAVASQVADSMCEVERDVRDASGRWHMLRARPYMTVDNKVDGAVLVLFDVHAIRNALEFTTSTIRTIREPLLVLDGDLRVRMASDSFYRDYRVLPQETVGRLLYELGNGQWNIPALRHLLEEILPQDTRISNYRVEHDFERVGPRVLSLHAQRFEPPGEGAPSILLTLEDVTERDRGERELARSNAELREHVEELSHFNRAAVARELRMIELKKEVNELCRRRGEPARYPLEFERAGETGA